MWEMNDVEGVRLPAQDLGGGNAESSSSVSRRRGRMSSHPVRILAPARLSAWMVAPGQDCDRSATGAGGGALPPGSNTAHGLQASLGAMGEGQGVAAGAGSAARCSSSPWSLHVVAARSGLGSLGYPAAAGCGATLSKVLTMPRQSGLEIGDDAAPPSRWSRPASAIRCRMRDASVHPPVLAQVAECLPAVGVASVGLPAPR